MSRLEANREIVAAISDLVEKYPDWRFHQILMNCDIESPNGDRWYEESEETLKKLVGHPLFAGRMREN